MTFLRFIPGYADRNICRFRCLVAQVCRRTQSEPTCLSIERVETEVHVALYLSMRHGEQLEHSVHCIVVKVSVACRPSPVLLVQITILQGILPSVAGILELEDFSRCCVFSIYAALALKVRRQGRQIQNCSYSFFS